jgi:transposase
MRAQLLQQGALHADETPVAMLDPCAGKMHSAYLWTYCSTVLQATKLIVFDIAKSRASRHPAEFLRHPRRARLARHARVRRLL